jgi:hypothetical protein
MMFRAAALLPSADHQRFVDLSSGTDFRTRAELRVYDKCGRVNGRKGIQFIGRHFSVFRFHLSIKKFPGKVLPVAELINLQEKGPLIGLPIIRKVSTAGYN